MRVLFALCFAVLSCSVVAQPPLAKPSRPAEAEIRAVIDKQTAAWNHQDLEGFMAGYWKSPELTFFSGATETKGWQPTLERYRKRYQSNGAAMGTLDFSELVIEQLGPNTALVRGRWRLTMPDGKQPHGLTTLLFRRFPAGWRIVHDHSSGGE